MMIGSSDWQHVIRDAANRLGVEIGAAATEKFAVHARELLRWNQKMNLTAITDPAAMALKHFVDAVAALRVLPPGGRLLDIGSGAGFPGIPLKIARPALAVTLVDASRRKVSFLNHLIHTLTLEEAVARHVRVEALAADPHYAGRFDVVICRAFSDLAGFVAAGLPLLAPGGRLVAMKGRTAEAEVAALAHARQSSGRATPLVLPQLTAR
ncbi:MAG: 16S rRNA (guanine(527)-N(7))-methyltransferase RsmG, partial [Desulfobacterales bacterium]